MYKKLKNIIKEKIYIKKIITFEKLEGVDEDKYIDFNSIIEKICQKMKK